MLLCSIPWLTGLALFTELNWRTEVWGGLALASSWIPPGFLGWGVNLKGSGQLLDVDAVPDILRPSLEIRHLGTLDFFGLFDHDYFENNLIWNQNSQVFFQAPIFVKRLQSLRHKEGCRGGCCWISPNIFTRNLQLITLINLINVFQLRNVPICCCLLHQRPKTVMDWVMLDPFSNSKWARENCIGVDLLISIINYPSIECEPIWEMECLVISGLSILINPRIWFFRVFRFLKIFIWKKSVKSGGEKIATNYDRS